MTQEMSEAFREVLVYTIVQQVQSVPNLPPEVEMRVGSLLCTLQFQIACNVFDVDDASRKELFLRAMAEHFDRDSAKLKTIMARADVPQVRNDAESRKHAATILPRGFVPGVRAEFGG